MREKMKGDSLNGNSRLEVFCEKSVRKNIVKCTRKHLSCSTILVKLQAYRLQLYEKKTQAQIFSSEF